MRKVEISFFNPLTECPFTPTEFSHSHRSCIHTRYKVLLELVILLMVPLVCIEFVLSLY